MEIEKAFPKSSVRIFSAEDASDGDVFVVTRTGEKRLWLEARLDSLHYPVPGRGMTVFIQSMRADASYQMRAMVLGSEQRANRVCIVVEQAGDLTRVQRRRCFRVLIKLPVQLTDLDAEASRPLDMTTRDIGAGGLCAASPTEIPAGHSVFMSLDIGHDSAPIRCEATVVRSRRASDGACELSLRFNNLSEQHVFQGNGNMSIVTARANRLRIQVCRHLSILIIPQAFAERATPG